MNDKIRQVNIRVKKSDAAMIYFILESNENIAFYSTLESSIDNDHRDIQINTHISLEKNLISLLEHFKTKRNLEVLKDHYIDN